MAWKVGSVHEQSDFIGFNIIDATSQRPVVIFSYSSVDDATNAHGLVAKALETAKYVGVVPPRPVGGGVRHERPRGEKATSHRI
jgi:hypothetical protein